MEENIMISIDEVEEYWSRRPCNVRHSLLEVGTREYFDQVAERREIVEPHVGQFAEFNRWAGKKVLEIGCGIGTDAVNFAEHGAIYTGIDLSKESVKLTKKRFEVYNLNGRIFDANAEELSDVLEGEKFDLIYSIGVIHHTVNPQVIIDQLKDHLTEDGEIKIMLYAKDSWKGMFIEENMAQPEAQDNCPIAEMYTEDNLVDMFKDFNITITKDGIFPYQIEPYKRGEYVKEAWFEAMPDSMYNVLRKKMGWHYLISGKPKT